MPRTPLYGSTNSASPPAKLLHPVLPNATESTARSCGLVLIEQSLWTNKFLLPVHKCFYEGTPNTIQNFFKKVHLQLQTFSEILGKHFMDPPNVKTTAYRLQSAPQKCRSWQMF